MKRWLLFTIAAIVLWGVYGVAFGISATLLSPLTAQVITSVGLLAPALFLIPAVRRERPELKGLSIGFASGLCGAVGNLALLAALRSGKAAIVVPLTALYPLVTVIIGVVLLGERARRVQVAGLVLAIAAVLLLSIEANTSWMMFALAAWLLYALASLVSFGFAAALQKLATTRVSAQAAFAAFASGFIPLSLVIVFMESWSGSLSSAGVAWAAAGGLLNALGVLATLAAYRSGGKASIVTPLAALYPVVTVGLSIAFVGGFVGSTEQMIGIVAAIVGGLLLACE